MRTFHAWPGCCKYGGPRLMWDSQIRTAIVRHYHWRQPGAVRDHCSMRVRLRRSTTKLRRSFPPRGLSAPDAGWLFVTDGLRQATPATGTASTVRSSPHDAPFGVSLNISSRLKPHRDEPRRRGALQRYRRQTPNRQRHLPSEFHAHLYRPSPKRQATLSDPTRMGLMYAWDESTPLSCTATADRAFTQRQRPQARLLPLWASARTIGKTVGAIGAFGCFGEDQRRCP